MGAVENPEHSTQRNQQSNHCNQGLNPDASLAFPLAFGKSI
jgi:hypothetical protein